MEYFNPNEHSKAVLGGNTTAVRAEASSASNGVDMSVKVTQLATKSSLESATKLTIDTSKSPDESKVTLNTKLINLSGATSPLSFVVDGGESITFTEDDTISTAMARINSGSGVIKATFDEVSGKLSITSNKFGTDNLIESQKVSGSLLTLLKMDYSDTSASFFKAQEAKVEITSSKSATAEVYTSTSNSLTVNGVTLTFLAKSDTTGGVTTIKTQADADKSVETIKAFVETYNELINTMATTIGEEKYRSFTPLTDEQKEAMSEKEIELWEKKAKSGLLKGDVILQTAISDMRTAITSKLGALSEMGITTGQYYENGKLYLNEDKLKQAILDNPQKVSDTFRGSALEVNGGIFGGLSTAADKALDKIVLKAGTSKFSTDLNFAYKTESVMGRMLKDYNSRINSLQDRLSDLETRYYKQFTAMETAMNKYNSQSSSLSSLFSN